MFTTYHPQFNMPFLLKQKSSNMLRFSLDNCVMLLFNGKNRLLWQVTFKSNQLTPFMRRTDLACSNGVWTILWPNWKCLNRILELLLFGQLHQCGSNQTGVQTTWESSAQTTINTTFFFFKIHDKKHDKEKCNSIMALDSRVLPYLTGDSQFSSEP